jgi:CBS domain-containing protein
MSHPDSPASSLMTPDPVTADPGDLLKDAVAVLRDHPFRHLPVVEGGKLVGIISDRDLLLACGGRDEEHPGILRSVHEIMTTEIHSIGMDTTIREASAILYAHRIGALPVVEGSSILGIVTETDLLIAFRDWCRKDRDSPWSRALVGAKMTCEPKVIAWDAPLTDALELCVNSQIRHLPVMHHGRLHGILSDRDIRRGLAGAVIEGTDIRKHGDADTSHIKVRDVATRGVMVISPDSPLTAAVFTMATNKIGALPVLLSDEVVGMISQTDILGCYAATQDPK